MLDEFYGKVLNDKMYSLDDIELLQWKVFLMIHENLKDECWN